MAQTIIKDETIKRIERVIGRRFFRGGDRAINEALDKMQNKIKELENESKKM